MNQRRNLSVSDSKPKLTVPGQGDCRSAARPSHFSKCLVLVVNKILLGTTAHAAYHQLRLKKIKRTTCKPSPAKLLHR